MAIGKMEVINKENQIEQNPAEHQSATPNPSELSEPRWSVVTYESIAAANLTYEEALELAKKLDSQKISGLCIITNQAAARISEK